MKAFLLAAGEGRRLRPLTDRLPKCLVPIAGMPLLGIWLRLLEAHGVSGVLVNTHYLADQVSAFLETWPTSMEVVTAYEPRLLGSAGTVRANRGFVAGEDRFFVIYADNLSNVDLSAMARFDAERPEPVTIGVVPTDRPREKGTVVIDPEGRIVAFDEKVERPRSNIMNAGIYVVDRQLFDELPEPGPSGLLDFGYDVLPRLVPRLAAYRIPEFLMDIGTPEAYAEAQITWPATHAPARP